MRAILIAAAAVCVCLVCGATKSEAADNAGQIPTTLLANLGISGMQPISDAQGMDIRGKGRSGSCIPSCRPVCQPKCQPRSCEPPPCQVKQVCVPVCRPKCGGGMNGGLG